MMLILIVLAFFEHDFRKESRTTGILYQLELLASKKIFTFVVFLFEEHQPDMI